MTLPKDSPESDNEQRKVDHWAKLRRLGLFQLKLAMDAVRDLLLSPVSILATLMDIVSDSDGQSGYFRRLMHFGRRSDRLINLFEQHSLSSKRSPTVDSLVDQIETIVTREYQGGEVSATAKKALDKSIETLKKLQKKT